MRLILSTIILTMLALPAVGDLAMLERGTYGPDVKTVCFRDGQFYPLDITGQKLIIEDTTHKIIHRDDKVVIARWGSSILLVFNRETYELDNIGLMSKEYNWTYICKK